MLPRTTTTPQPAAASVPLNTVSLNSIDHEIDEMFLALVSQPSEPMPLPAKKRKCEDLDPKVLDLKERNRQSAKASRLRKKARLETLHKQIDELTSQNLELAQTAQDLAEDNEKIREELRSLGWDGQSSTLTGDPLPFFLNSSQ